MMDVGTIVRDTLTVTRRRPFAATVGARDDGRDPIRMRGRRRGVGARRRSRGGANLVERPMATSVQPIEGWSAILYSEKAVSQLFTCTVDARKK
jgi:hypothetical protein